MSAFDPIALGTSLTPPPSGRCPWIRRPLPQCYCYDVTSSRIEAMIRFCGGNYRQCDIFKMISRETRTTGECNE